MNYHNQKKAIINKNWRELHSITREKSEEENKP